MLISCLNVGRIYAVSTKIVSNHCAPFFVLRPSPEYDVPANIWLFA